MEKENALEKAFAQIKEAVEAEAEAPKTAKKAAKKPAEKKETKAAEKKTAAAKKEAPVKKTPAKTTSVKKTAKKETAAAVKTAVTFEFNGKKLLAKDILERAMQSYQEAHKDESIESFELYIVAAENAAYYVVNGVGSDTYKIAL